MPPILASKAYPQSLRYIDAVPGKLLFRFLSIGAYVVSLETVQKFVLEP